MMHTLHLLRSALIGYDCTYGNVTSSHVLSGTFADHSFTDVFVLRRQDIAVRFTTLSPRSVMGFNAMRPARVENPPLISTFPSKAF